ncbi:hypothetical protein BOSE62_150435 [Bosea sp. 62]|nr:hypothetical protein BOSE46_10407 [Bosea sp. 46]CAD5250261.1 hypothetical protein BOSE21B_10620 [Bosea sp. 21B]CAD5265034.1 hypothetical protein BOSE7B_150516 [Bosea sp. 7B]VVT44376.1 hypothetical protein BOS5A_10451 [Bosea sp. EC-HK365B]VXB09429.1 hypothetical protein BOSE29B_10403 [Bosea sp. 29B]VXB83204.1 hypothetical protein BOSE62_150435 [Bosea sp. 62]VXC31625.1 hypothetical protein BOSE125_20086 [Bosea sp. 125]VXC45215.1 hypothetical protein BOSE127_190143 [Bosea sp. 127]
MSNGMFFLRNGDNEKNFRKPTSLRSNFRDILQDDSMAFGRENSERDGPQSGRMNLRVDQII